MIFFKFYLLLDIIYFLYVSLWNKINQKTLIRELIHLRIIFAEAQDKHLFYSDCLRILE